MDGMAAETVELPIVTYSVTVEGLVKSMPCSPPVHTCVAATLVLLDAATSLVVPFNDGRNAMLDMARCSLSDLFCASVQSGYR